MVTRIIKILYLILSVSYIVVVAIFFLRFEISYRIVNARPEIVQMRDLTYEEYKGLQGAEKIRTVVP
jgi:hypothetical protein